MTLSSNEAMDSQPSEDSLEQNIWSSIMKQVQNSATNKLPSNKAVLILGEDESGKTSLIAKMQGNEELRKGSGLEYHHLLVRDEYRDEQTRLGLWVMDGDVFHQNLLTFALNEETIADTSVIITASMTTPWSLLDSLEKWADILTNHIERLNISSSDRQKLRARQEKRFLEYISPGDEIEGTLVQSPIKTRDMNESFCEADAASTRELPDGVLARNLGVDIIICITKTDYMTSLEKNLDYKEEHFDFIQQSIRKFCLLYGASLFYVSAKMNKNTDLLFKYLVHRIYGLPFKTPALVVEKDALFIPCGWDNEKKISILYENIQTVSPDDTFDKVISQPDQMSLTGQEVEVTAEDDQNFLAKMQSQLTQNIPSSANTPAQTFRPSPSVPKGSDRKPFGANVTSSPLDRNNPGGEGVLQNFFNSLLNRKSTTNLASPASVTGSPRPVDVTPAVNRSRADVSAELDRMTSDSSTLMATPPTHFGNVSQDDTPQSEIN